ncbi:MAG: MptD family putative ECF transporter S component [Treponema sp.]|jgi:energy-coupling factor transport system substrate-specific component|nr:MptD family putative ECF transporter S component [Treponema sp.]
MGDIKKGLRAKDLITVGIFTALFIVVDFAFAMLLSGLGILVMFITSVCALVSGTFFLYVAVKVRKFGAVTIMSFLVGAFMFLAGHFWPCLVFGAVFGLGADFLAGRGGYKNFWWNAAGYVVMILGFTLDGYTPMVIFRDAFVTSRTQMGMSAEFIQMVLDFTHGPLLIASFGVAVACALIGAFIGRLLLRKHFEKAGIL